MEDFSGTSSRLAELMWSAVRECESRRTQLEREGLKKAYLLAAKEDLDADARLYLECLAASAQPPGERELTSLIASASLQLATEERETAQVRASLYREMHDEELRLEQVVKDVAETDKELAQHAAESRATMETLKRNFEVVKEEIKEQEFETKRLTAVLTDLTRENERRRNKLQELQAKPTRGEEEQAEDRVDISAEALNTLRFRLSALQQECDRFEMGKGRLGQLPAANRSLLFEDPTNTQADKKSRKKTKISKPPLLPPRSLINF